MRRMPGQPGENISIMAHSQTLSGEQASAKGRE